MLRTQFPIPEVFVNKLLDILIGVSHLPSVSVYRYEVCPGNLGSFSSIHRNLAKIYPSSLAELNEELGHSSPQD
jgi:hypothetical protein